MVAGIQNAVLRFACIIVCIDGETGVKLNISTVFWLILAHSMRYLFQVKTQYCVLVSRLTLLLKCSF